MMRNKKIIGITGGSGCGKSYISELLRRRGIPVVDADITAHEVMEQDKACVRELCEYFGADIFDGNILNRKKLGKIVFSDPQKLDMLNKISHKYILAGINNKIEKEKSDIVCVDGATLIESGMKCDMMIGVLAEHDIRKNRIMLRDGISQEAAQLRLGAQQPEEFYKQNCDFIVYNNGAEPDIDYLIKRMTE